MALSNRLVQEELNFLLERSVFPKFLKFWGEQWLYKEVTSFHVQISLVSDLVLSSTLTFIGIHAQECVYIYRQNFIYV